MTNPVTPFIGQDAYVKFDELDNFSYNCVEKLMTESELIWRLLYHNEPDAYKMTDLSQEQKAALVYDGTEDSPKYKVFLDSGDPDTFIHEIAMLRIYPYYFASVNRSIGYVEMAFEMSCHYKINHLSNYKTRVMMMSKEIIRVFNGSNIGGLGLMYMDKGADQNTKGAVAFQAPFKGNLIIMSTNIAVK